MRGAVICVGVMLAIVQLWPVLFGGAAPLAGAATTPAHAAAVTMVVPPARAYDPADAGRVIALSCHAQYRHAAAACSGD